MKTWYLLYDGSSADGRGTPRYIGRTLDKVVAERHYKKCENDPYCTGKVIIITDIAEMQASYWTNWKEL